MELTINCPDCGKTLKVTVVAEDAPRTEIIRKVATPTTWHEIAEKIKAGKAREFLSIGDIVPFEMKDGQKVNAVVAGIDIYGENEVVFVTEDCLSDCHAMNESSTNAGGWRDSNMREYLNTAVYNLLPDNLKDVIVQRTIRQNLGTKESSSTDNLWLLSKTEVGLECFTDKDDVCLPLFTDERSRVKQVNGETTWYWLRSPLPSNSSYFHYVGSAGNSGNSMDATNEYGVAFGFLVK